MDVVAVGRATCTSCRIKTEATATASNDGLVVIHGVSVSISDLHGYGQLTTMPATLNRFSILLADDILDGESDIARKMQLKE